MGGGSASHLELGFCSILPLVFALNLYVRVLIKHTVFIGPVGWFLRYCGGIPIDRRAARDYVGMMAEQFEKNDVFHLVVTPEGTRSPAPNGRLGFIILHLLPMCQLFLLELMLEKRASGLITSFTRPVILMPIWRKFMRSSTMCAE